MAYKDNYSDTLDAPINQNVISGMENMAVKQYLKLMADNQLVKTKYDANDDAVQKMFEEGFEICDPQGTRKISSQKLYQAFWRTANRMKPLDFTLHAQGRPREIEQIVTAGVSTVMDKGGYDSALRDKGGSFFSLLLFGDGPIQVGSNPDKKAVSPIAFNPIAPKDVYVDMYATGMRTKGWGRNVTKAVVIFSYSWGEFCSTWPEFKDKAGVGKIPRDFQFKDAKRSFNQESLLEDEIEVAYAYDIRNNNYTVFAGQACTVLEEQNGDDYPFIKDDEPYIPICQFICVPSSEGFRNHGIGAMIFKLAMISQRLMNMEYAHIEDNVYPIELVNVAQDQAAKFFNKLKSAHEMRANGKKGFVVMERQASDPNSGAVSSQTLLTQNLLNEWKAVMDAIDREIRRLGINIDELESGPNATATEVLALEENSNAFVKQVMEWNASESQFMVELTLDFIKKFISKNNKTKLNLTTTIKTENGEIRADSITLGMVADELKKHEYFVKINSRTGAIPSKALQLAQLTRGLQLAQPGSQAHIKITEDLARLNDLDIPGAEFLVQQAPVPQEGPAGGSPELTPKELGLQEEQIPTGTDRLTINARSQEQTVAL